MSRTTTNIVRSHEPLAGHRRMVVHTAEGIRNAEDLAPFFRRVQADAHSATDRQGDLVHMVHDTQKAWHVAAYNGTSLGNECCEFARFSTREWVHDCNRDLLRLAAAFSNWGRKWHIPLRFSVAHGICGHVHLGRAGGGHWDPGPHFPWKYFIYLCRIHHYRHKGWNKSRGHRGARFRMMKRYCYRVQRRYGVKPRTRL